MRELQVLVHPRLRFGREVRRQLAGRKHHLVIAIGQMVAIHVHIVELVIKTYGLRLLVGLKQRTRIPETDVLNGALIPRNRRGRQIFHRRVGRLLDGVQLVGFSREVDVAIQIGSFQMSWFGCTTNFRTSAGTTRTPKNSAPVDAQSDPQGFPSRTEENRALEACKLPPMRRS